MTPTRKWTASWGTTTWDSLPTTSVTTKLLTFGLRPTRTWPLWPWSELAKTSKDLTRYTWCWILEPVVRKSKFVSWPECVDWWPSRRNRLQVVERLSKTLFFRTLKKDFRFLNTLSRRTVHVKDWLIRPWKRQMPVTWPVVWSMYRKT